MASNVVDHLQTSVGEVKQGQTISVVIPRASGHGQSQMQEDSPLPESHCIDSHAVESHLEDAGRGTFANVPYAGLSSNDEHYHAETEKSRYSPSFFLHGSSSNKAMTELLPSSTSEGKGHGKAAADAPVNPSSGNEDAIVAESHPSLEEQKAKDMIAGGSDDEDCLIARRTLQRPIFKLMDGNYTPPASYAAEPKTRPAPEGHESPYRNWRLYTEYKEIIKADKETWPPSFVLLQDWHINAVIEAGIGMRESSRLWPADFNSAGAPQRLRSQRGRAAKLKNGRTGLLHYAVVSAGSAPYQLHGDEGGKDLSVPTKHDDDTLMLGRVYHGSPCIIQKDFRPYAVELLHGVEIARFPPGKIPVHQKLTPLSRKSLNAAAIAQKALEMSELGDTSDALIDSPTPLNKSSGLNTTKTGKGPAGTREPGKPDLKTAAKDKQSRKGSNAEMGISKGHKRTVTEMNPNPLESPGYDSDTIEVAQPISASQEKRTRYLGTSQDELSSSQDDMHSTATTPVASLEKPATSGEEMTPKFATPVTPTQSSFATALASPIAMTTQASGGSQSEVAPKLAHTAAVTLRARRAQQLSSAQPGSAPFWASEAANLLHTLQDTSVFLAKGLATILEALDKSCETEDLDEAEKLTTAAMARAQHMRENIGKFVTNAGKGVLQRAKANNVPEFQAFRSSINDYKKPNIAGLDSIHDEIKIPGLRVPDKIPFENATKS